MKATKKYILTLVALTLCVVMAVPVAALSTSEEAGIYIMVFGRWDVSDSETLLETMTWVKTNPDEAYLVTTVEYANGAYSLGDYSAQSQPDVNSFSYDFYVPYVGGYPNYVYTCHEVRGGISSTKAYAARSAGSVNFS